MFDHFRKFYRYKEDIINNDIFYSDIFIMIHFRERPYDGDNFTELPDCFSALYF